MQEYYIWTTCCGVACQFSVLDEVQKIYTENMRAKLRVLNKGVYLLSLIKSNTWQNYSEWSARKIHLSTVDFTVIEPSVHTWATIMTKDIDRFMFYSNYVFGEHVP